MSVEEAIMDAVRGLPPDKQQELLRHATRLREEAASSAPRRSVKGLWADLNISLDQEDIDEVPREMWRNFPRKNL